MEKFVNQQTSQIARAFRQSSWRVQMQVIALLAVGLVVLVAISGMYLTEAARAATAGRDVQSLEETRDDLLRANDLIRSDIAQLRAVERVEARARELGFVPATVDDLKFVYFEENVFAPTPPPAVEEPSAIDVPEYNETLAEWLLRTITGALGGQ